MDLGSLSGPFLLSMSFENRAASVLLKTYRLFSLPAFPTSAGDSTYQINTLSISYGRVCLRTPSQWTWLLVLVTLKSFPAALIIPSQDTYGCTGEAPCPMEVAERVSLLWLCWLMGVHKENCLLDLYWCKKGKWSGISGCFLDLVYTAHQISVPQGYDLLG